MSAAGSRAFSALYFLSKRTFSQHLIDASWTGRSTFHSKPTGLEKTVRGSFEFVEWHNGGGLFHRTANIDPSVFIEFGAIVHHKAIIGADVHIGSGSIVGPFVSIGQSTNIRIGDHVEIGANSCIDRGSWRDTVVGDYTKIDNLVQIGHNVVIGKSCMLCGQVGIAGSATIGDYCTFGGRVAVKDHVTISSKVRFAANSCVTKDVGEPGDYAGFPAVPIHQWRRQSATIRRLSKKDLKVSGS